MAHGDAPRYRVPETQDENGATVRLRMVRDKDGQWVDRNYLVRLKYQNDTLELRIAGLKRQLRELQDAWETRDLLEVSIMKMTEALVHEALK